MLARRIARTALTSPVTCHTHHLHHLHPRHIAIATQTIVEPTLDWTPGETESGKRGRGRPPDKDIVKRPRGRPRKLLAVDEEAVEAESKPETRGRPRKLSAVHKEAVEPEKKTETRGRPRKLSAVEKVEPERKSKPTARLQKLPAVHEEAVEPEKKSETRGRPRKLSVVDEKAVEPERKSKPTARLQKPPAVHKEAVELEKKSETRGRPRKLSVEEAVEPGSKPETKTETKTPWAIEEEEPTEQFVEPVLDWVSGHRQDFLKAARFREIQLKASGIEPDAIETPRFNWLPTSKEGHDPRLPWQGTIRGRLGAEPATLLALREVVKRRRTRPPEPEKELVNRYPLFELPSTSVKKVARKVISNYQNASEAISDPTISIGKARWTAIDPRRVPEGRLRVESFSKLFGTSQTMDKPSEPIGAKDETVPSDANVGVTIPNTYAETSIETSTTPTTSTAAPVSNPDLKRIHASPLDKQEPRPKKKNKRGDKRKPVVSGSSEEVMQYDVKALLTTFNITEEDASSATVPEYRSTLELTIVKLASSGDGLAVCNNRVYCVPFTIPGDVVEVKVRNAHITHSMASLIRVITPSPDRDDSLINCKYFSSCSGCQYQMLPYEKQLEQKRHVVEKAFTNFSDIPTELLPKVLPTMGSPLKYGYRTKLTPHFNGPRRGGFQPDRPPPNIGFVAKLERYTLDIEDCPIGTDNVRQGFKDQREWVKNNLDKFKRGATLLLRESTNRVPIEGDESGKKYIETKQCITDSKQRSVEYFGNFKFNSPAGSFFQNNNSILESFTDYIRENLHLPVTRPAGDTTTAIETTAPKYLVDAYCGSGLFTVACGQGLEQAIGVDIDENSITSARKNAKMNNINNATFVVGEAEAIFKSIKFPGAETSLIVDPPRKGCGQVFLDQLLNFAPKRIVYVSCNVHTQARDIGYILKDEKGRGYTVDSIKGFDFFPQTHHVEGVAVLTRAD